MTLDGTDRKVSDHDLVNYIDCPAAKGSNVDLRYIETVLCDICW